MYILYDTPPYIAVTHTLRLKELGQLRAADAVIVNYFPCIFLPKEFQ